MHKNIFGINKEPLFSTIYSVNEYCEINQMSPHFTNTMLLILKTD